MADGSDVPVGTVVHTLNGDYMKMEAGKNGVAVTPVPVVLYTGEVVTGYVSKEDNLTYMLGGTRPAIGSAVVTRNGDYLMTSNGGALLPSVNTGTLSQGASGNAVVALQVQLNVQSNAGLTLDGKFGTLTDTAVRDYQAANGLTVDGRVGPQTSAALGFGYVAPKKSTGTIVSSNNQLSSRGGVNDRVPSTVCASVALPGIELGLGELLGLLGGGVLLDRSISHDMGMSGMSLEWEIHKYSYNLVAQKISEFLGKHNGSDIPLWQEETEIGIGKGYFASRNDPYARPGQKEQGRELKEKKKDSDDWVQNPNKRPQIPKKHTPSRDHRKY
jgi:hypothetical protein